MAEHDCPDCTCGEHPPLNPVDSCPECPCDEWTGYCGHFDCGACSSLRHYKEEIRKRYEDLRK